MPSRDFLDVVGAAEIAELLGHDGKPLSRQRVTQLTQTPGFPPPARRLKMGAVLWADDIRKWAEKHRPGSQ